MRNCYRIVLLNLTKTQIVMMEPMNRWMLDHLARLGCAAAAGDGGQPALESYMHFEVDRQSDPERLEAIRAELVAGDGADFATIAGLRSDCPSKADGGKLGIVREPGRIDIPAWLRR